MRARQGAEIAALALRERAEADVEESIREVEIRTLAASKKQRDQLPYVAAFPGNLKGAIVPTAKAQIAEANRIADVVAPSDGSTRVAGLPSEMAALGGELRTRAAGLGTAVGAHDAAIHATKTATTQELIERKRWREQYNRSAGMLRTARSSPPTRARSRPSSRRRRSARPAPTSSRPPIRRRSADDWAIRSTEATPRASSASLRPAGARLGTSGATTSRTVSDVRAERRRVSARSGAGSREARQDRPSVRAARVTGGHRFVGPRARVRRRARPRRRSERRSERRDGAQPRFWSSHQRAQRAGACACHRTATMSPVCSQ
jgi:hypothetical protein